MRLKGQVALITGAAGEVGEAIAARLAGEGVITIINDLDLKRAEKVSRRIIQKGGRALPVQADVSDPAQVKVMVEKICRAFKTIHILVNNAGLYIRTKGKRETTDRISIEEWNRYVGVNLSGAFYCIKYVIPLMRRQKYGAIVNISSQAGKTGGLLNGVHYAATKAGLIGLTKGVAREAAQDHVRVNCVAPGRISTPDNLNVPKEFHKRILGQISMGRLGTVEEVAEGVLFLVSDASSYMTGATLDINGGWLMD